MATKEYFPGIGKIKFEGKESMNTLSAQKVVTNSVAERNNSLGMVTLTLCKQLKINWMQVSNSCRRWVSNTIASTM